MKHSRPWRLASLAALALLFLACASQVKAANTNPTFPLARQSPQSANVPATLSPFGVQILTGATNINFLPLLAKAKTLGVQWVRVYLAWSSIQGTAPSTPGCGNCIWSYPDTLFNTLAAQGLYPIVTVTGNPRWAATYSAGPIDPAHLADFGNFVSALVQRYPNVKYWEFYNEPDERLSPSTQRGWAGHADQYAAMLRTVYNVIHPGGAVGNQYVVFGGVAYEPSNNTFDPNFIGQVLTNAKGSPLFDVMAYHYYDAFASGYSPPTVVGKALKLNRIMQSFGFPTNKPFVVSEIGKSYQYGTRTNFTHEIAARKVTQMFSHVMAAQQYGVNIVAAAWFTLEHYEEPTGGAPRMWGLLDPNANPWPLEGAAYSTVVGELVGTSYVNRITVVGVTGYNFKLIDGTIHAVLWATTGTPKVAFKVTTGSLRWLNKVGIAKTVADNRTGDYDTRVGWIKIAVTASPIFVEYK